jgi:hypothetical protein
VAFILEGDVGQFQLAAALHEDTLRAVDQDVVDRIVLQQRLQRSKPLYLEEEVLVELQPLLAGQDDVHLGQRLGRDGRDLRAQFRLATKKW